MVTLGMPEPGTQYKFSRFNWLAPGARPHMQELGEQGVGEICCYAPSAGSPSKMQGSLESKWAHMETSSGSPGRAGGVRKNINLVTCLAITCLASKLD